MPAKKSAKFAGNRNAAIGLIVVCIVGTAILIAARSSEPTVATVATPTSAPTTLAPAVARARTSKAPAESAAKPQVGETAEKTDPAEPVTIEGCLVQVDETFRLKNTSGDGAPRGRSWKSGFLKKSSKTIALVDDRHRLNLAGHVGERVTVAGMLDDHELQAATLKRVAETCD